MSQLSSSSSKQRSERRIAVRLPLKVSGRDIRGILFEEETASENLCRNGAAFVTRFDLPIGSDLDIRIPYSQTSTRRPQPDFATRGRVVHVAAMAVSGEQGSGGSGSAHDSAVDSQVERLIGVQFTGPRFRRVFRSESAN
jgi:hypothetical protein